MYFLNLKKSSIIARALGLKPDNEFKTIEEPVEVVDPKTKESSIVTELKEVGEYAYDDRHRNVYLKATGITEARTVTLSGELKTGRMDIVYAEANPVAIALGLIHAQILIKPGEALSLYFTGNEANKKKLLDLDWVIKLSAIRGDKR